MGGFSDGRGVMAASVRGLWGHVHRAVLGPVGPEALWVVAKPQHLRGVGQGVGAERSKGVCGAQSQLIHRGLDDRTRHARTVCTAHRTEIGSKYGARRSRTQRGTGMRGILLSTPPSPTPNPREPVGDAGVRCPRPLAERPLPGAGTRGPRRRGKRHKSGVPLRRSRDRTGGPRGPGRSRARYRRLTSD